MRQHTDVPTSSGCEKLSATDSVLRHMQKNNERVAIQVQRLLAIRESLLGSFPQAPQTECPKSVPCGFFAQYNEEQMTLDGLLDALTETVGFLQNM